MDYWTGIQAQGPKGQGVMALVVHITEQICNQLVTKI